MNGVQKSLRDYLIQKFPSYRIFVNRLHMFYPYLFFNKAFYKRYLCYCANLDNNTESYWLDKAEQILAECIKFCRLYNNGYVSFEELHNFIINKEYYDEKIKILKNKFSNNEFNSEEKYNLLSALNFFEKEFFSLDSRSMALLKSQITRITSCFITDYNILNTFSPKEKCAEFSGIKDIS